MVCRFIKYLLCRTYNMLFLLGEIVLFDSAVKRIRKVLCCISVHALHEINQHIFRNCCHTISFDRICSIQKDLLVFSIDGIGIAVAPHSMGVVLFTGQRRFQDYQLIAVEMGSS